jgi:hypothetical protein
MKGIHSYERPPEYRVPGESGYQQNMDYDKDDNLKISRTVETYLVSTKDKKEKRIKSLSYTISPDGEITQTSAPSILHFIFPGGSPPIMFEHFLLTTGRGFSQYFTRLTSQQATVLPSQLRRVDIDGGYSSGFVGKWTISYDQEHDVLIREAVFTRAGKETPLVTIRNTGLVTCPGLSIAQSGVYTFGTDDWAEFEVTSLKSVHSSQPETHPLYIEVLEHITAPLPPGRSTTIDRRTRPPTVIQ